MVKRPRVLIVGGPDVDKRIPLANRVGACGYQICLAGTHQHSFSQYGLSYYAPTIDGRIRKLSALVRCFRPHIIQCFDTIPGLLGGYVGRQFGLPSVCRTITGLGSSFVDTGKIACAKQGQRLLYKYLQRRMQMNGAWAVFQNPDDYALIVGSCFGGNRSRTRLIPGSGIDTQFYVPADSLGREAARKKFGLPLDGFVIGHFGRLVPEKGLPDLVEVSKRIHPRPTILVGGTIGTPCIDKLIKSNTGLITYVGHLQNTKEALHAADCVVLPSVYREGIPRILMEAASCGLPTIAYDVPGSKEAIDHSRTGFLVAASDRRGLAIAICSIRDAELNKLASTRVRARDFIISRYSLDRIAMMYADLWSEIISTLVRDRSSPL